MKVIKNGKRITALVPGDGCLNYIYPNDEVLMAGLGGKGDVTAVSAKVVKVAGVSLNSLYYGRREIPPYGI